MTPNASYCQMRVAPAHRAAADACIIAQSASEAIAAKTQGTFAVGGLMLQLVLVRAVDMEAIVGHAAYR